MDEHDVRMIARCIGEAISGALEKQCELFERVLDADRQRINAMSNDITEIKVDLKALVVQQERAHEHLQDLSKQQRQDAADIHEKINDHAKDGHAGNIRNTVAEQRERGRDSLHRIELLIGGAGVIAAILIAVFK